MDRVKIGMLKRKENIDYDHHQKYLDALEYFDADVLVLDESNMDNIDRCSGILLPGGDYKQNVEDFMIWYALENNLSLLGICQGMQSMAIYNTDNEIVKLPDSSHNQTISYRHNVTLCESNLKRIIGENKIKVNSYHKQTVKISKEFRVVGRSDDGLIEAIEKTHHPFQIGVQWHPEKMYNDVINRVPDNIENSQKKLLKAFVNSCRKR